MSKTKKTMEEVFALYQIAYLQQPPVSAEQQQEAINQLEQWSQSPESIPQIAESFSTITHGKFCRFILTKISNWLKYSSEDITPEIIEVFRAAVFDQTMDTKFLQYFPKQDEFVNTLAHVRVGIFWLLYPDPWASFWTDLQSYPEPSILSFLDEFAKYSQGFMSHENKARYNTIKDAMRADTSDALITQYILNHISNTHALSSYKILNALLKWINLQFIINDEALAILNTGLSTKNQDVVAELLSMFRTLIKRGMPDENRQQVMEVVNPIDIYQQIIQLEMTPKIVENLSSFIEAAGYYALQYQIADGYLDMAVNFIDSDNADAVIAICPFFMEYLKVDNSVAPNLITKIIERNTTIPTKKSQVFSTAEDNQTSVDVRVLQGEREFARDNKLLGDFRLEGILPARRGVPQIEVTFDIDANGIVHVSAKDLGTGKEQSISITSSSNMSKEDIDKAVKDAEKFAQEDKQRREEVDTRNNADQMIYQCEKILSEEGDKFDAADKSELQTKVDALKEALKGSDIEKIKSTQEDLTKKFYEISEKLYKANAAAAGAQGAQGAAGAQQAGTQNDDGSINVDYTDVTNE